MKTSRTLSVALVAGGVGLFALAATTEAVTGCSAILDTSASQCTTNADCAKFGAAYACISGGCSIPPPGTDAGTPECATNAECIARLGDFHICRKTDFKCAPLLNADCPRVLGKDNWKSDDAVILGSILPILGPDKTGGIPLENSLEVGLSDFTQGSQGLPPAGGDAGANRRPLAIVSCTETTDSEADDQAPVRSATHLVGLGVPAIVGASFSGNTQRASTVTIQGNVLLMSPTATSVAITALQDNNLVWRTSPSDVIQVKALVAAMPDVEQFTRQRWALGADAVANPLRVWILHKADSYGKGLAEALEKSLVFNNKPALDNGTNFVRLDYGDPDSNDPPPSFADKVAQVTAAVAAGRAPHLIFLLGTNETITGVLSLLEPAAGGGPAWADNTRRPTYLFADGGLVTDLWDEVNKQTDLTRRDSLRKRIFGTVPGTTNTNYQTFVNLYGSRFNDGTGTVGGTSNTYDALYLLAFGIAGVGSKPVTGPNIAEALKRVVKPAGGSAPLITPGSSNINQAFQALATGNIDYDGASGPLDFDLATGEAVSDIQVWCLPKDGSGQALGGVPSGAFYDSKQDRLAGGAFATKVNETCP